MELIRSTGKDRRIGVQTMERFLRLGTTIDGATAVVIGRSKIVGTPMLELLKHANATVTICHSKTKNIEQIVSGVKRRRMIGWGLSVD